MTTAGRFPPLDFHLMGHDARGFSYTYNEKKYFRDFQRRVSYREHFKKRVVSLKGLRGFRCSEGSEKEGRSRGGGVRPGPVSHPARPGFFVAQLLKRPQRVARLLCRQQQKRIMYNEQAIVSWFQKWRMISWDRDFCIMSISDACISSLPFMPVRNRFPMYWWTSLEY